MGYFEQAQRYEMMSEVAKILQPFYEKARDSKVHVHVHACTPPPVYAGNTCTCMYPATCICRKYMYMHVPRHLYMLYMQEIRVHSTLAFRKEKKEM